MAEPAKITIAATPSVGDPCAECADAGGYLVVYSGHTRGSTHVRYTRCWRCGHRPKNNKITTPAATVQRRRRRIEKVS